MANQTDLLNVSDEMKLDDMRQELCGSECGEELCSSSSDTTEELYSSSEPDTCGVYSVYTKNRRQKRLSISCLNITYEYLKYRPCYKKSYYEKSISNSFVESYINLSETPILVGGKKL